MDEMETALTTTTTTTAMDTTPNTTDDNTNHDDLTEIVSKASKELADQYKVDQIAAPLINHVHQQVTQCNSRIQDTERIARQIQTDTQSSRDALASLRQQSDSLEQAFASIDQLEVIVNQMNNTLTQVTANVDDMEKTVQNSIQQKLSLPMPFLFSKRSDSPLQPYFPPPQHVDIPSSKHLFDHLDRP
ncbi:hypothetical protein BC941DRAFT_426116 [Chlamydoabsidia padenii]|nr:hypothetical protein BC941DRAFT_426116 [Chlamydoabsidia padenii]